MNPVAVKVRELSKCYRVGISNPKRSLASVLGAPLRNLIGLTRLTRFQEHELDIHWALRDVSFDVEEGEVLGIVGHNGAGKSTLLKILARITTPTTGVIELHGTIASLLEVGTGFHPELTGRENVFLNGTILGMTKKDIEARFDEIVEFAEVNRFIDTPVKRYSSGMAVRLAFAVASTLTAEILIIDEVLAVGDFKFQERCLGKMREIGRSGRTVLFVSHNLGMVRALCGRALLLQDGRIVADGAPDAVLREYQAAGGAVSRPGSIQFTQAGGKRSFRLIAVESRDSAGSIKECFTNTSALTIRLTYSLSESIRRMGLFVKFYCEDGTLAFSSTDLTTRPTITGPGIHTASCSIPSLLLNGGTYHVHVAAGVPEVAVLLEEQPVLDIHVDDRSERRQLFPGKWPGAVAPELEWAHHWNNGGEQLEGGE